MIDLKKKYKVLFYIECDDLLDRELWRKTTLAIL